MSIWEMMTESVRKKLMRACECESQKEFIENYSLNEEGSEGLDEFLDDYGCFQFGDFIFKTKGNQIVKGYYLYEIYNTVPFGKNKEMLLITGCDEAVVLDLNTLKVLTRAYN